MKTARIASRSGYAVRYLDDLGRVVVPHDMRRALAWDPGTPLEIRRQGDQLILVRATTACVWCGNPADAAPVLGRPLCAACRDALRTALA